jgi:glycosyltransferase involved in cell wall biosynthesis
MAKICILSSVHDPFDTRVFQKQARTMVAAGHDVTFVVPFEQDVDRDGVHICAVRRPKGRLERMLRVPFSLWREARRLDADVYHFHDPELVFLGLLLRLSGRRVIYDVHENVPLDILGKTYLPKLLTRPLAAMVNMVEKNLARHFTLVVLAREDIADAFAPHPRLLLVRNFPARSFFASAPQARPQDRAQGFSVVYSGGLVADRGVREMISALDLVRPELNVSMDIYGRFWPEEFERSSRALPAFRHVRYHGWLPYSELPQRLAAGQAGIVCFLPEPNNVNSGPTKLFEYMALGLPVIASHFPMWREVVEGNQCGLCVDPADPHAIATAIEWLADHPAEAAAMGERGRAAVMATYNWETEGERLMQEYDRLLAG